MDRTRVFIKNTIFNYIFRIIGILLGFFTIPITLKYLGDERFGVWQTILSIISWATLANFGISNGLRNTVSKLLGENNNEKLRDNISSAYFFVGKISIIILIVLISTISLMNTDKLFKGSKINTFEIKAAFIIIAINFCINFVLGICSSIAYGIHKSYYITIQQTGISFVTLVAVYIINFISKASIVNMALVYSIVNTIGNIIMTIFIGRLNANLKLNIKYCKKNVDNSMYKLGMQFFFVQVAALILASTDNFLVSALIGAEDVTYYSIVNKLFITVNTVYMILIIPLWNSTADANTKGDYRWIKKTIVRLLLILIPVIFLMLVIILGFDLITKIWIGRVLHIERNIIWLMAIYVLLLCFNSIFTNIQNGLGKINIQIVAMISGAVINIPLAFLFVKKFGMGMSGVVLSNIMSQIILLILCPLDVIFTIKKRQLMKKGVKDESCNKLCR